jgi:quinol monooxygenase YgiN
MIIRIVKMTFAPEATDNFLQIFNESKHAIRSFPGCIHLELMEGIDEPGVLITFSKWMGQESLEAYRNSELFRTTWQRTKVLFIKPPLAFSMSPKELVAAL